VPRAPYQAPKGLLEGARGVELWALLVPSTAPPSGAASGQLCCFTGIQQENSSPSKASYEAVPESTTSFRAHGGWLLLCRSWHHAGSLQRPEQGAPWASQHGRRVLWRSPSPTPLHLSCTRQASSCADGLFGGYQASVPTLKSQGKPSSCVDGAVVLPYGSACARSAGKRREGKTIQNI